jgi:hypothetical protein
MCIAGNQVLPKSWKLLLTMCARSQTPYADKADDILNQPAYNKDGERQVGYVGASISKGSVQRAAAAVPGLGALARLGMDNFVGTTFVKLFMYNACEGLFPFHSDVLPTSGKRKIRPSVCAGRSRVSSLRCTVPAASF